MEEIVSPFSGLVRVEPREQVRHRCRAGEATEGSLPERPGRYVARVLGVGEGPLVGLQACVYPGVRYLQF